MTKKLEESLDLCPRGDFIDEQGEILPEPTEAEKEIARLDDIAEDMAFGNDLIDDLEGLGDTGAHAAEVDAIAARAICAFDELQKLAKETDAKFRPRLYEVSATVLNVALHARDSKLDRKLKSLDLKLKKMKIDNDSKVGDANIIEGNGMDRNDVLAHIKKENRKKD